MSAKALAHGSATAKRHDVRGEMDDDAGLIARVVQGDTVAFSTLAKRHLPRILGLARRMLRDAGEAEDVAQDVLVRLWQRAPSLEIGKGGVGPWLMRVAANRCRDYLRQRRPGDAQLLERLHVAAQGGRLLEARDLSARVGEVMAGLPERQRFALSLFHFDGFTMKETAETMETTPEAVESLLARARRRLKQELAGEWRALLPEIDE